MTSLADALRKPGATATDILATCGMRTRTPFAGAGRWICCWGRNRWRTTPHPAGGWATTSNSGVACAAAGHLSRRSGRGPSNARPSRSTARVASRGGGCSPRPAPAGEGGRADRESRRNDATPTRRVRGAPHTGTNRPTDRSPHDHTLATRLPFPHGGGLGARGARATARGGRRATRVRSRGRS